MTDDPMQDPRRRMRSILSSGEIEKTAEHNPSPLSRLPRARPSVDSMPPPTVPPPAQVSAPPPESHSFSFHFGPAFWTITGLLSLVVNAVLIAIVIYVLTSTASLQLSASSAGGNILAGLYTNFEKMDRASITSTIPVDGQIPLALEVPIQQTTRITLASDAVIQNARVRITSPALNIDAPAQVTLPAGTSLDVALAFNVQVQDSVPVHLEVPVNIPLAQTQLHEPFVGLQQVIRPWYCLIQPFAVNLDGQSVCR